MFTMYAKPKPGCCGCLAACWGAAILSRQLVCLPFWHMVLPWRCSVQRASATKAARSPWHLPVSHQLCWWDAAGSPCSTASSALREGLQDAQGCKITSCVTSRVNSDLNDWVPSRYTLLQLLSLWKAWQKKFYIKLRVITRLKWPADSDVQTRNVTSCNVANQPLAEKCISY